MQRAMAACLAAALGCLGQQAPTFRAGTTLVEFTVVAVDAKGEPVLDLTASEMRITEHGQARATAVFRFDAGAPSKSLEPLPPGIVTNRAEYQTGPARNVTAILLDGMNTPGVDQMAARDQAMAYLRTIAPDTSVAVYRLTHELVEVHDFTSDAASLRRRLEESVRKTPAYASQDVEDLECFSAAFRTTIGAGGDCEGKVKMFLQQGLDFASAESVAYQAFAVRRLERTLVALEAIGDRVAGIPGRKSLIWIGGGVPMVSVTGVQRRGNKHSGFQSFEEQIRRTAKRLASQGVAVYPVDSLGMMRSLTPPLPDTIAGGAKAVMANVVSNYHPEATHDAMAALTGGRVVRMTNDFTKGSQLALADQRASYTIGFYAPDEPDGKWHDVTVKTTRPGVKLTYRQGYLAASVAHAPEWTDARWKEAIGNPIGSTAIRLDGKLVRIESGELALLLQIDADDLQFAGGTAAVEVGIAEKAADGSFDFKVRAVRFRRSEDGTGVLYPSRWIPAPSTATVRVIVRDQRTARYGSLDMPVPR
jgi:VWFA-related protein